MTSRLSFANKWDAYARKPFPLLVRLSMNRIFHGSNAEEEEDLNMSIGLLLALLAVPGGFIAIFLFDKYGSFLQWLRGQTNFDPLAAALPDEYFFIVLSMVVTGGVGVWWWDNIFPDRRDFTNLVHLPIPASRIFAANSVAILVLTCVCAIDVNAASSILFPLIVGASQLRFRFMAQFAGVHALVVVLASIFSLLAVFATAGLLMLLLPYAVFRRISLYARSLIAASLVAMLSTSFAVPRMILDLPRSTYSSLRLLPSAWFLGFCQLLRGRADPVLAELGHVAVFALVSASAVAAAAYTLAYRRCFLRLPELADAPPGRLGARSSWFFYLLDLLVFRTPFQRAGYRFVIKTLLRNETHALALGGFLALGAVFASQALFSAFNGKGIPQFPTANVLSIPLILGYCMLLGIRFVFDIPAPLRANLDLPLPARRWCPRICRPRPPRNPVPRITLDLLRCASDLSSLLGLEGRTIPYCPGDGLVSAADRGLACRLSQISLHLHLSLFSALSRDCCDRIRAWIFCVYSHDITT